jgi:hypothetical protein
MRVTVRVNNFVQSGSKIEAHVLSGLVCERVKGH